MKRLIPLVSCVAACGFNMPMGSSPDAAPGTDANIDAAIDAEPDALDMCVGEGPNEVCFAELPSAPSEFAGNTMIDTSVAGTCAATTNASASGWCVIAATRVLVLSGVTLRVMGDKPVVFAATGDIEVGGIIDVSSRVNTIGAGGNASTCVAGGNATGGNSSGGGYGGSFGGRGGNGEGTDGGTGGVSATPSSNTTLLRGGCPGGPGGPLAGTSAAGGAGGGALALLSRTTITLTGAGLNASGAGGHVGSIVRQGSGGGGSGGMIVLDAPAITASGASIFANGGGGGEGNDLVNVGLPGTTPFGPTEAGEGGAGVSSGGDGGAGSLGLDGDPAPMNASTSNAGGGGGGGGAGVIRSTVMPLVGADVSPAPVGTVL